MTSFDLYVALLVVGLKTNLGTGPNRRQEICKRLGFGVRAGTKLMGTLAHCPLVHIYRGGGRRQSFFQVARSLALLDRVPGEVLLPRIFLGPSPIQDIVFIYFTLKLLGSLPRNGPHTKCEVQTCPLGRPKHKF
jgi:hypothetical protein